MKIIDSNFSINTGEHYDNHEARLGVAIGSLERPKKAYANLSVNINIECSSYEEAAELMGKLRECINGGLE